MDDKLKEQTRERVKRYRERQKSVTLEGVTSQGLTQYHAILDDLINPVQRQKLEAVCLALKRRSLQSKVFYGIGKNGLPMDVVGELLDATNKEG